MLNKKHTTKIKNAFHALIIKLDMAEGEKKKRIRVSRYVNRQFQNKNVKRKKTMKKWNSLCEWDNCNRFNICIMGIPEGG